VSWETLLKQASETGTASHPDTGATETSATESSATESGATESGATETSATETSATESGATESGATQTSATQTSATESGATQTSATTHTVPGASAGRNTSAGLATPPRLGGGITGTGRQIAASVLRGLLCDADILPIVLGGSSEILDVGREHRLVTPAIRAALNQRDQGCVFPGCDAAPEASHAHHITPWWNGGTTALHNLVLLCPHHHAIIEPGHNPNADRWRLTLRPDGISEIRPPRRVDPQQKPRVHARFLTGLRT
jgi:HNH endonuclease